MKKILLISLAATALFGLTIGLAACAAMGDSPTKEQIEMYKHSENYDGAVFHNALPVNMHVDMSFLTMTKRFFFDASRRPEQPLPMQTIISADFSKEPQPLQVVWLGHSTTILDIDGVRLLIDPVFENASPVPMTIKRYQDSPISRDDLPRLDAVVISHDHYDHLEMATIKKLIPTTPAFIVPLGVGAHLKKWGCPADKIIELDWWQKHRVGDVEVIATPSRHFSGRGINDRFKTLWASFAFKGPDHSAFYSADGSYDGRFKDIAERLGTFDLTMIEAGAYDKAWPDAHMFPEQSVQAHQDLGGKYMLPVHWAAYDLAFHQWDEPIIRTAKIAEDKDVTLLTPLMGEPCVPGKTHHMEWWKLDKEAQ